jgi:hypothetical protein
VLLASALTFVASLFLSWVQSNLGAGANYFTTQDAFNLFDGVSSDGWGLYGQAATLVALALAAGAGASLLRPGPDRRLPLVSAGVALLYLALFNAAQIHGFGVVEGAYARVPVQLGPTPISESRAQSSRLSPRSAPAGTSSHAVPRSRP